MTCHTQQLQIIVDEGHEESLFVCGKSLLLCCVFIWPLYIIGYRI